MKLTLLITVLSASILKTHAQRIPVSDIFARATTSIINNMGSSKPGIAYTSEIQEYRVVLKDSTEMSILSKIYIDSTAHSYIIYSEKASATSNFLVDKKLYSRNTLNIVRLKSKTRASIDGRATDSCWLFKVIEGKINLYSFLPDVINNAQYFKAMQIDNGVMEPFNEQKLRVLMAGNLRALNFLDKKDYYKAINRYNDTE